MNNKLKVMTIVGTRPEIIKLSQVMKELDQNVEHTIVHTGQNYDYELNELFFEQLGIRKPDIFLEATKGTPCETIGDIIAKADNIFSNIQPDALLIYGDTNSCLSVIPAKEKFQFFIWRQEIDVLIKGCLKKLIEKLLII